VPLIRPIAVIIIAVVPSADALPLTPSLCQTSTVFVFYSSCRNLMIIGLFTTFWNP
jgi:hypothetical protein